ncbi:hypothetical protein D3C75_787560 [compost metagenome]
MKYSINRPATDGPVAGANMMTSPTKPIAAPRCSGGYTMRIVLNMSGINSPIPTACKTRANINISKLKASAAIKVPAIELVSEAMNSCLVVNLCSNHPVIGINIPSVSKKPVVSHCAVAAEIWNTSIKLLIAILRAVSLNMPTKPQMSNDAMIARVLYFFIIQFHSYMLKISM